jgi:hypothetical protein
MAGPGRIDVHHHMVPDFYRETLAGLGPPASAGVPLPPWSPAASLEVMDAIFALDTLHADGVVLLASNAGTFLGDPAFEELMAQVDVRATVAFVHSAPARSAGPGARATLTSTQSPTAGTRRPPPHGRGGLPQSVDDSSKAVPPGGGPSTHGGEACQ